MKRVLSLLLLIPFLSVQVLAGSGGPWEDAYAYSQSAWAGTYGIALQGNEAAGLDSVSTIGVLTVSVPTSGLSTGRMLIFDKGLMYVGAAQGQFDPRKKRVRLLAQASHYAILDYLNNTYSPVVDYILSGQMDLTVKSDYETGMVVVNGDATFARYDPIAEALTVRLGTAAQTSGQTAQNNLVKQGITTAAVGSGTSNVAGVTDTGILSAGTTQTTNAQNLTSNGLVTTGGSTATTAANQIVQSGTVAGTSGSTTAANTGLQTTLTNAVATTGDSSGSSTITNTNTGTTASQGLVNGAPSGTSTVKSNVLGANEPDSSVTTVTTNTTSGSADPTSLTTTSVGSGQNTGSTSTNAASTTNNASNSLSTSGLSSTLNSGSSSATSSNNSDSGTTQSATQTTNAAANNVAASTTALSNTKGTQSTALATKNSSEVLSSNTNANNTATTLANNTQNATSTANIQYTDPNEIHHTTPVPGVSTVKGSDTVTVGSSSELRPGMTISGPGIANGTTVIKVDGTKVTLSKPAMATASGVTLSSDPSSIVFLTMTADGFREDTAVVALAPIAAPSAATNFQVGVTQIMPTGVAPATGTGTGGTGAGGGGGGGGGGVGGGGGAGA